MKIRKMGIIIFVGLILIVLAMMMGNIVETVDGGEIHVKQGAVSGDFTVIVDEGLYMQMFGKITTYQRMYRTYLSDDDLDGGKGAETSSINVRFGDGGTADISSVTEWRLPLTTEAMVKIKRNYTSSAMIADQARQWVIEVEKQVASTFKADETYSTRRGEFSQLITEQIINGLYKTEAVQIEMPTNEVDDDGNPIMGTSTIVRVKLDDDGEPIIVKIGTFREYGLTLVDHKLKDIDYDDTIDKLISQKKEAEQQRVVAITNAEKAKQDAITAEETGKARVAQARADEEVAKITAVTRAEKDKAVAELKGNQELEVARLDKLAAGEAASARLITEKAEADANKLKVSAGLTPQQAAEWDYKIADVVSKNLASVDLPDMMIFGGGEGSPMNPWDAVGLESFMNIADQITNK